MSAASSPARSTAAAQRDLPGEAPADAVAAPRALRRLWCAAAVGAIMIHAGCVALAVGYLAREDDPIEESGAPALEIAPDFMAPQREPTELPPGPDSDAAAAAAASAEQREVVKDTELPKAAPTETDDPDRVVTPDDHHKPEDDDSKPAAVQTPSAAPEAAREATAMPSLQTAVAAPVSAAPVAGTGESLRRVRNTWETQVAAHLHKHLRYPDSRDGQSADVLITVVFDRSGRVLSSSIARSSGDRVFDDAALAMMRRANPVPAPPPVVADAVETLSYTFPVNFRRNQKNN